MKSWVKWAIVSSLVASWSMGYAEVVRIWPESLQMHTRVVPLAGVRGLSVDGSVLVTVIQGDKEELILQANELVLDRTHVGQENGFLKISSERRWPAYSRFWSPKLTATLVVRDLNKAITLGGAVIKIPVVSSQDLELEVRDFGRIEIDDLNAGNLSSFIDTIGEIVISGTADQQFVVIGGAGVYQARSLATKESKIDLFRLGIAYLNVSDTLDATIQGEGKIYYRGSPKHVYQNISKAGQLMAR